VASPAARPNVNQSVVVAVLSWILVRGETALVVPVPAHSPSPMAQLIQSTEAARACLRQPYPYWSPEAEMQRSEVKSLIGGSMDYAEMSRRALGDHWAHLSTAERSQFVAELRKLIENRYVARGGLVGPDSQIHFEKEAVTSRGTASVYATVSRGQGRRSSRLEVEYRVLLRADRWFVYDLVTGGTSLLESYRDEFNAIIARESFSALLQKIAQQAEEVGTDR
jgi:phospholipid transport system substrate-binding protein